MNDPQGIAGNASAEAAIADLAADVARHAELPEPPRPGPPPPPADLTAAAFFDVDNTLVHGSSMIHFARGLAERKYFTYSDLMRFALRAGQVSAHRPREQPRRGRRTTQGAGVHRGTADG